jgi:hypothetical protein
MQVCELGHVAVDTDSKINYCEGGKELSFPVKSLVFSRVAKQLLIYLV